MPAVVTEAETQELISVFTELLTHSYVLHRLTYTQRSHTMKYGLTPALPTLSLFC